MFALSAVGRVPSSRCSPTWNGPRAAAAVSSPPPPGHPRVSPGSPPAGPHARSHRGVSRGTGGARWRTQSPPCGASMPQSPPLVGEASEWRGRAWDWLLLASASASRPPTASPQRRGTWAGPAETRPPEPSGECPGEGCGHTAGKASGVKDALGLEVGAGLVPTCLSLPRF